MDNLLNITKETLYVILGIMGGAVCALHFVSALAKEKIAKIAQYVNIGLHIMLFCALLLSNVEINVAVMIFAASVFLYVLIFFVKHEYKTRKKRKPEVKESKNL